MEENLDYALDEWEVAQNECDECGGQGSNCEPCPVWDRYWELWGYFEREGLV